jgi:hypothetical protein
LSPNPKPKPYGTFVICWLLSVTRVGIGGQIPAFAGCSSGVDRTGVPVLGIGVRDCGFPGVSGFVVQPAVIETRNMRMIQEPTNRDFMFCLGKTLFFKII